jgi:hypothetical protein
MNAIARPVVSPRAVGRTALEAAARLWFVVALVGQWLFAAYTAAFYGGSAARGDVLAWNKHLPHGYTAGDQLGNLALITHLVLAAVVSVGGPLQLVPRLRSRFPAFHRWSGRLYMLAAFILGAGGLYLTWSGRRVVGDATQHVGVSLNAVLILVCAAQAWRHALARRFDPHRRWALRLFLAMSGVWFFRVGLMSWLIVWGGPVGFDPRAFQGPFLSALSFGQTLVPLALLEAYLRARDRGTPRARYALAGLLLACSLATAVGVFGTVVGMWLPRL